MNIYFIIILVFIGNLIIPKFLPKKKEIYDVGHEIIPKLSYNLSDYILWFITILAILNYKKFNKSYLKILIIMFLMRLVTIGMTILPRPKGITNDQKNVGFDGYNDYIFSGHSTFCLVTSYFIGAPYWPILPLINSIAIIGSRNHYTVDVILSWFLFFALITKV